MRPTPANLQYEAYTAAPFNSRSSNEFVSRSVDDPNDWVHWDEVDYEDEGEEAKRESLRHIVARIMERNFTKHLRYMRGAHVKSHAFVKGTLVVSPALPSHLQYGLFTSPGRTFTTIARYSSESSHIVDDRDRGVVRAIGVKVLGVDGEKIGGGHRGSQDFLFNNSRSSELYSLDAALEVFKLRDIFFDDPDGLELALRSRSDAEKLLSTVNLENIHLAGGKFYAQMPIRFGPYVARLSLLPATAAQVAIALKAKDVPNEAESVAHQKLLRAYFHTYPAVYIIRAQFASRNRQFSIEDTSIPWDSPWVELGRLEFPVQESYSDARRVWFEESLALSPWNGLVEHQPLGSLGRARKTAYEESRRRRAEKNVEAVYLDVEPQSIPD
ncbi:hypothetical protein P7C70_g2113, partial [Phenoliferia sp. Uapishka_3]